VLAVPHRAILSDPWPDDVPVAAYAWLTITEDGRQALAQ
jgi:hypothetical protein